MYGKREGAGAVLWIDTVHRKGIAGEPRHGEVQILSVIGETAVRDPRGYCGGPLIFVQGTVGAKIVEIS